MRIAPLGKVKRREFALLTPGQRELRVTTLAGDELFTGRRSVETALAKLSGFACYLAAGLDNLKHTTGARSWVMSTWHGRETRMTHVPSGTVVTSLRGCLEDTATPFEDLARFVAWAGDYGIGPAGLSSMAWALLRASLTAEVSLGVDPAISGPAFFGGRQGVERTGSFFDQRLVDKVAAYPTAMACRPVALSLGEVDATTTLDESVAGLARATVTVPIDVAYPPLPVRVGPEAIQFQWGTVTGTWSWVELAHAKALGCAVTVEQSWAPAREANLFFNWWVIVSEGRRLPGGSAHLAKAVANCLWGQLAMTGSDRAEVGWSDEAGHEPYVVTLPDRALPHQWGRHVAAEITARVRTDLLTALIECGAHPAHVDTDGLIIGTRDPLPRNTGAEPGQFRVKADMVELEVRAPQFYRWRGPGQARWNYTVSGMTEVQARHAFTRRHSMASRVSYLGVPDMCLPDGFSFEPHQTAAWLDEGMVLR